MMAGTGRSTLSLVARYALAAALACGAMLLRAVLPLGPGLGIYPLALAIVVLSAWYAGRGPGWLATLVSATGARYFFIEPTYSLAIHSAGTAVGLLLFVAVALLLVEFSMARRCAEQALAESERRFRLMAENVPEVFWIEDLTPRRMSYLSPGYERIWGRRVADLYRDTTLWMEAIHPQDRPRVSATFASWLAEAEGAQFDVEYRIVRPDGTTRWIHDRGVLVRDERGKVFRASGIAEDITERKRIEAKLRTSEEHWKQVFENNPTTEELRYKTQLLATITDNMTSMLQMVDAEGRAIYLNPATERITGYRPEELIGQVLHEKLHHSYPDGRSYPASACPLTRVLTSMNPVQCEEFLIRKDGTFLPVFCSATPIFHDTMLRGAVAELLDLTERNRAQQAMVAMQAELAHVARMSTMGELAASIAHDVNQPLAAIVANGSAGLRWLGAKPPNVEEARQAIERVIKEGTRAGEIISGIRALLRKAPANKLPVDVNEAIAEVVALMRAETQRRHVTLDMRLSPDVPSIRGDRAQLQQVLLNLVLNGLEATCAASEGPRELVVSSEMDASNGVLVSVRDTGVGFDDASAGRLFDAFYTTKEGGTGMGLAISRSIIEAHRGRIWAAPNSPRGAVFRFTLPAVTRAP
jgi:PAS domain S-box-containing protein